MVIRRFDLFITLFLPVIFFVLGYVEYLNSDRNTQLLEYLVVPVSLIAIIYYYYKNHPDFLFTSAMPFYYYIGMCVSLLLINNSVHMIEVDQYGSPNGSVLIMLAYFFYSIGVSKVTFSFAMQTKRKIRLPNLSEKVYNSVVVVSLTFIVILGFLLLLFYGGPVINGINRVAFWTEMESKGLSFYPSLMIQTFYFVVYYYFDKRYNKAGLYLSSFLLISYFLLTVLLLGQKFSAFIIYFAVMGMLLPSFTRDLKLKKTTFILLFLAAFSLIMIVSISYVAQGYSSDFILTRIALQGQVLWSIINFEFPEVIKIGDECLFGCASNINLMDYISYKLLPLQTYLHYSATGTTLSGFAPAAQFLTMGLLPTFILQTLVFAMLGYLQAKTVIYNRERNFIVGFLLFKVSFSLFLIWHAVMFTAIKGMIFTLGILLIYALVAKSKAKP